VEQKGTASPLLSAVLNTVHARGEQGWKSDPEGI